MSCLIKYTTQFTFLIEDTINNNKYKNLILNMHLLFIQTPHTYIAG